MVVVEVFGTLNALKEFVEARRVGVAEVLVRVGGRLERHGAQPAEVGAAAPAGHLVAAILLLWETRHPISSARRCRGSQVSGA